MLVASTMAATHRDLAGVDLLIIGIYFVLIFGIGFYFARKGRSPQDYFLASRNIGWFAIGASLFVSNISTEHFIGLAGSGATSGLAVGHFEWLACLILLLLGWVFVPFYLRSNVFTMPEFLERRFNRSCATYLASISVIAYIFTKISVHLYAAAIVLERVVGWSPMTAAIILVAATGVYNWCCRSKSAPRTLIHEKKSQGLGREGQAHFIAGETRFGFAEKGRSS
jgi:solute:Na+ symporter, SSS family